MDVSSIEYWNCQEWSVIYTYLSTNSSDSDILSTNGVKSTPTFTNLESVIIFPQKIIILRVSSSVIGSHRPPRSAGCLTHGSVCFQLIIIIDIWLNYNQIISIENK